MLKIRLMGKKENMPVLIRNLNDDEATIIMVDSNIQREDIAPRERILLPVKRLLLIR